jgi:hypothetical protein
VFASLGLPEDRLSASILSFARFFSLCLEPSQPPKIRRQVLRAEGPAGSGANTGTGISVNGRASPGASGEALILAAMAAADKGVELTPAGLARYAAAIEPDRGDAESGGHGGGDMRGQDRDAAGGDTDSRRGHDTETAAALHAGDPPGLAKMTAAAGREPLLDLLNRLPGKNGQRWIVLPVSFVENGAEYRISLRILLDARNDSVCMVMEIHKSGIATPASTDCRWIFSVDRTGNNRLRLELRLWPPRRKAALASLAAALEACMTPSIECISVQNCGESFVFPENDEKNVLRSINEEV